MLPTEDPQEFEGFSNGIHGELAPVGEIERALVERVVSTLWRLRRLGIIETGVLTWQYLEQRKQRAEQEAAKFTEYVPGVLEESEVGLTEGTTKVVDEVNYSRTMAESERCKASQQEGAAAVGRAYMADAGGIDALSKLHRYQVSLDRSLYQALHELQRMQAARLTGRPTAPPLVVDVNIASDVPSRDGPVVEIMPDDQKAA